MSLQDFETLELVRIANKYRHTDRGRSDQAFGQLLLIYDTDLKKLASRYYINGSDPQDVLQECRLGLLKAVEDFTESGGMSFRNFAINLCVKRHVITAMAAANRKKYDLHNNAVSLDTPISTGDEEGEQSLADFIPDTSFSLIDSICIREEYALLDKELKARLTPLERTIYNAYGLDESYKEIADLTDTQAKTVDNALMRIRKKAMEVRLGYEVCEVGESERLRQLELAAAKADNQLYSKDKKTNIPSDIHSTLEPILAKIELAQSGQDDCEDEDFLQTLHDVLTPLEEAIFLAFYSEESTDEIKAIINDSSK